MERQYDQHHPKDNNEVINALYYSLKRRKGEKLMHMRNEAICIRCVTNKFSTFPHSPVLDLMNNLDWKHLDIEMLKRVNNPTSVAQLKRGN